MATISSHHVDLKCMSSGLEYFYFRRSKYDEVGASTYSLLDGFLQA